MKEEFYGKYRGTVTDIEDPLMLGRIKAKVPDVLGDIESGWALPCAPFGGSGNGFFVLPSDGAMVWIEFEQGNPARPIWSGCMWTNSLDMPPILIAPPYKKLLIVTAGGNRVLLDDTPGIGGITLETAGGQKIEMTPLKVEISNGMGATISMQGPKISFNNGALEILF